MGNSETSKYWLEAVGDQLCACSSATTPYYVACSLFSQFLDVLHEPISGHAPVTLGELQFSNHAAVTERKNTVHSSHVNRQVYYKHSSLPYAHVLSQSLFLGLLLKLSQSQRVSEHKECYSQLRCECGHSVLLHHRVLYNSALITHLQCWFFLVCR